MCGRYSLATDIESLEERFRFRWSLSPYQVRFNIAPTQEVLTVTSDGSGHQAQLMKWGLIPFWAKDSSIGNRMINARAETVAESRVFRRSFRKRRCLILADGFYEWRKVGKTKVPMRFILKSGGSFGFAGLWDTWESPEAGLVHSCTIITTTPNKLMDSVHNRMPVILPKEMEKVWLDPKRSNVAVLQDLLVPYTAFDMEAYEVSFLVNSSRNETPEVIARVG